MEVTDPQDLPHEVEGSGVPVEISVEQEETHEDASGRENILISQKFERWKLEQEFKLRAQ